MFALDIILNLMIIIAAFILILSLCVFIYSLIRIIFSKQKEKRKRYIKSLGFSVVGILLVLGFAFYFLYRLNTMFSS